MQDPTIYMRELFIMQDPTIYIQKNYFLMQYIWENYVLMQDPTIYMRELYFNAGSYNIYERIMF